MFDGIQCLFLINKCKKAKQTPKKENISQTGHVVYIPNQHRERHQKKKEEKNNTSLK